MVIVLRPVRPFHRQQAILAVELVIALSLLVLVLLPMAFAVSHEDKLARAYYARAIALELIDGEMEVLMAGEWQHFDDGVHIYSLTAASVQNLPPGQCRLIKTNNTLRLEWAPARHGFGGPVAREVKLSAEVPNSGRTKDEL